LIGDSLLISDWRLLIESGNQLDRSRRPINNRQSLINNESPIKDQ
jgi:hypothetical protein